MRVHSLIKYIETWL